MTRPQPRPIGRGWATVDLERAERELRELIVAGSSFEDAARSGALGARCRRARGSDGEWILVLEPDSEGVSPASWHATGRGGQLAGSVQPTPRPIGLLVRSKDRSGQNGLPRTVPPPVRFGSS
jgi:hypothetical protein